jgi:hypothetical protein
MVCCYRDISSMAILFDDIYRGRKFQYRATLHEGDDAQQIEPAHQSTQHITL